MSSSVIAYSALSAAALVGAVSLFRSHIRALAEGPERTERSEGLETRIRHRLAYLHV